MKIRLALLGSAMLLVPALAVAVPRTFVSATGGGATCSRDAPCREFATALAVTDAGGEVVVLSSGGFEPFTIVRGVTVNVPPGIHASVRSSGPTDARYGVTVAAPGTDTVVLRGLTIDTSAATSNGSGASGILYTSAGSLVIEDVDITGTQTGYSKGGIVAEGSPDPRRVFVRNTTVRGYLRGFAVGLLCCSTRPVSVEAFIEDSRFIDNAYGVYIEAQNASEIVVRNNVVAGGGNGIQVVGPAASKATIEDNLVAFHAGPGGGAVGDGIQVGGVQATLARNLVVGNTVGVKVVTGTAASRGDNIVRENGTKVSGSVATVGGI